MRLNPRKSKNHPFLTILEKKEKNQKKSIDEKSAIETFNNYEHDQS